MSRSVSFGAWLCLLPLISTSWCIKKVFNCQVSLLQGIVLTLFPDLPTELKEQSSKVIQESKKAVQPMVGVLKVAALR